MQYNGNNIKAAYTAPRIIIVQLTPFRMLAESTVSITVADDEYGGEGRVKQDHDIDWSNGSGSVKWNDTWY